MAELKDCAGAQDRPLRDDFVHYCGIVRERLERGFSRVSCQVEKKHLNQIGIVHGGLSVTLMDTAAGQAGLTLCGEDRTVVTQCADIHFLHPIRGGTMYAEGRIFKEGRQTALAKVELLDQNGVCCVYGTFELFFVHRKQKAAE